MAMKKAEAEELARQLEGWEDVELRWDPEVPEEWGQYYIVAWEPRSKRWTIWDSPSQDYARFI